MKSPFSRFFNNVDKEEVETKSNVEHNEEVVKIPLMSIIPNRFQPRTIFDDSKIE